jgi:predicted RNA-binding Zn-ribbon protein involved in translation (DUF1610 family)
MQLVAINLESEGVRRVSKCKVLTMSPARVCGNVALSGPPSWNVRLSRVYPVLDHALVHCPSCDGRATVMHREDGTRLACPECGHTKTTTRPRDKPSWLRYRDVTLEAYDADLPPFGARLWLETECCGGNRLWAMNESHLHYLAAYISETQREREFPSPPGDRQLAYKLPTWMKLAKNRDEVLRSIERLRATL